MITGLLFVVTAAVCLVLGWALGSRRANRICAHAILPVLRRLELLNAKMEKEVQP